MKAMTIVRTCLAAAALSVAVLVLATSRPAGAPLEAFVFIAAVLLPVALLTYIGAVTRGWLFRATGVDITWPLLLLGLLIFGISQTGLLSPPHPDGCHTAESASAMKSAGFKLWVVWSAFAFLGLGAAISKKDSLSRLAGFIFPLALIVSAGALLGMALGDPVLCE